MADTRTLVRRIVCAAGIAGVIAGAAAVTGLAVTPVAVAQTTVDCAANPSDPMCIVPGGMPGMPGMQDAPDAPNLESGGGQDSQQHSGHH